MKPLNLNKLKIFHTAALVGKLSKAADILDISQPAVSMHIKQIEESYGGPVFERSATGVDLTELGEIIFKYTEQIVYLEKTMIDAIDQFSHTGSGNVSISASSTPGNYILPWFIGGFVKDHPNINVSLAITNTENVLSQLLSRVIDLGIGGAESETLGITSFPLAMDRIVLVCKSQDYEYLRDIPLNELIMGDLIMREAGSATRMVAEKHLNSMNLSVRPTLELSNNEAIKSAVRSGLGISILSAYSVEAEIAAGSVKIIDNNDWDCSRRINVYYRDDDLRTPAASVLIQALRNYSEMTGKDKFTV